MPAFCFDGLNANLATIHKSLVYRLWLREGPKVPRKQRTKRRLGQSENRCVRHRVERRNHGRCWDFIFDRTERGSSLKRMSVVDEFTRERLCLIQFRLRLSLRSGATSSLRNRNSHNDWYDSRGEARCPKSPTTSSSIEANIFRSEDDFHKSSCKSCGKSAMRPTSILRSTT